MTNDTTLAIPRLEISAERYYGLEGLKLEDCGQINLIVGKNNCGKTTVLKWIFDSSSRSPIPLSQVFHLPLSGMPRIGPRSPQEATEIASLIAIADSDIIGLDEKGWVYRHSSPVMSGVLGTGVNRLLQIAIAIARAENGVVLIDDAEIGLHPEIVCKAFAWIVRWAKKHNVQMFLTTHSLDLVDILIDATGGWGGPESDEDNEDDIPENDLDLVLFRLEPRDGETQVVRHGRDRLRRLRGELGVDVLL